MLLYIVPYTVKTAMVDLITHRRGDIVATAPLPESGLVFFFFYPIEFQSLNNILLELYSRRIDSPLVFKSTIDTRPGRSTQKNIKDHTLVTPGMFYTAQKLITNRTGSSASIASSILYIDYGDCYIIMCSTPLRSDIL